MALSDESLRRFGHAHHPVERYCSGLNEVRRERDDVPSQQQDFQAMVVDEIRDMTHQILTLKLEIAEERLVAHHRKGLELQDSRILGRFGGITNIKYRPVPVQDTQTDATSPRQGRANKHDLFDTSRPTKDPDSRPTGQWKPCALNKFSVINDNLLIPPVAEFETFSWAMLTSTFGGQQWSPGFYCIPPHLPSLLTSRSYYIFDSDFEPYLPSAPGARGARVTAFLNNRSVDSHGNSRRKVHMSIHPSSSPYRHQTIPKTSATFTSEPTAKAATATRWTRGLFAFEEREHKEVVW